MSIISVSDYKEQFEKLISDTTISDSEFDCTIEDLIYQAPIGAMQKAIPFIIRTSLLDKNETCSVLKPSAASDGNWKDGDIKEAGIRTREYLRTYPSVKKSKRQ